MASTTYIVVNVSGPCKNQLWRASTSSGQAPAWQSGLPALFGSSY